MSQVSCHPKKTIHVGNLPNKIKKTEILRSLYGLFSQFGAILDINYNPNFNIRNQSWIVFQEVASAANAVRQMNSFMFYNKVLKINFSLNDSDAVAKMNGTYVPHARKKKKQENINIDQAKQIKQSFSTQTFNVDENEPNNILLLINLPSETDEKRLQIIFGQFPGLKEVRLIQNRHDVAFVEYSDISQAIEAKESLQGYMIQPDHPMKIVFAKN